jgi:crotonobetainyl-CoA:carnitine CoA-transferase CaiB-like acyl-CoA transferase
LEAEFSNHGADHWYGVLTAVGVPAGPINDMAEAFTFAEKLGLAVTVPVPGSSTPQVANPVSLSATPVQYRSAPPRLGEHLPN